MQEFRPYDLEVVTEAKMTSVGLSKYDTIEHQVF